MYCMNVMYCCIVHKVRGFTTGLQDKLKRKEILTKRFIKTGPAVVNQNGDEVPIDDVGDLPEGIVLLFCMYCCIKYVLLYCICIVP